MDTDHLDDTGVPLENMTRVWEVEEDTTTGRRSSQGKVRRWEVWSGFLPVAGKTLRMTLCSLRGNPEGWSLPDS